MNRYIISGCVLLALISGCVEQADTIVFSASHCDDTKDAFDQSIMGVQKATWVDETTLEITALVPTNCSDDIRKGSFEIVDDTLILYYHYKKCFECSTCVCVRELLYTIQVEKKEYQFEVKSVEIK
jgi:hypothetical protein